MLWGTLNCQISNYGISWWKQGVLEIVPEWRSLIWCFKGWGIKNNWLGIHIWTTIHKSIDRYLAHKRSVWESSAELSLPMAALWDGLSLFTNQAIG